MEAPSKTLADIGEFALVDALSAVAVPADAVLLGPGDDTAVLRATGLVLASTDVLVEGHHFRREWCAAQDVGHRAAAASMADITAMGGRTTGLLVGFAAPGELPAQWAYDLAAGLAEEAALTGASVVGGDVTAARAVVIAVTALGVLDDSPVTRSGARPGDVVALAGRLGWAAAGLAVLRRGFRSPRALVAAYCRPQPPYESGPAAARAGASAMIDVSDGLVADVGHLARASGVAVDLDTAALVPAEPLVAVSAAYGVDPLHYCLGGGDDHALVATFPTSASVPERWTVIGTVAEGNGVTVDGRPYEGPQGHEHFRVSG